MTLSTLAQKIDLEFRRCQAEHNITPNACLIEEAWFYEIQNASPNKYITMFAGLKIIAADIETPFQLIYSF